jgi:NAD(P)-dependent dehydrogenase (short-subunit alcohol dehydrogenase family)
MKLEGRIAFVTGASSGLGRHLALTLARAGADLALTARRTDRLAGGRSRSRWTPASPPRCAARSSAPSPSSAQSTSCSTTPASRCRSRRPNSPWARHDIQVNAILPGYIETEMNGPYWRSEAGQTFMKKFPRRRVGQPTELDELTLLLSGAGSNFMSGSIILIDDAQSLMGY